MKSAPFGTAVIGNGPPDVGGGRKDTVNVTTASSSQHQPEGGFGRLMTAILPSPNNANARYSRPGLASVLVQVAINAVGGHVFARAFVLPHLGRFLVHHRTDDDNIIVLSCLLVSIFEYFSVVNSESELNYPHYDTSVLDDDGGSLLARDGGARGGDRHRRLAALLGDVVHRVRRSVLGYATMLSPLLAAAAVLLWSRYLGGPLAPPPSDDGPFVPSLVFCMMTTMRSLLVSYATAAVLVSILAVQDVLARWAICAPGTDADVLLFRARSSSIIAPSKKKDDDNDVASFLAEDLIVQSVLMGDGLTVDAVIAAPPGVTTSRTTSATSTLPRSVGNNHQEDEIHRNEMATSSFSTWIERSSTTASGRLSDDILRMCILESLGGGGSSSASSPAGPAPQGGPYYFGRPRHAAAVRRRLDLSAATSCPGRQPIAAPIVRALCAFAGGIGDALSRFYRSRSDNDGYDQNDGRRPSSSRREKAAELWKVPPGSLHAAEFAIIAAARLVVMNSVILDKHGRAVVNTSRRHDRLSLLLPCVLQSAYKLHRGIHEYAEATASMCGLDLSTYDTTGKGDGVGCYIAADCRDLCPVISACKDSAKMTMKILVASGDRSFEDLLLRRKWKGDMQQWLVGL